MNKFERTKMPRILGMPLLVSEGLQPGTVVLGNACRDCRGVGYFQIRYTLRIADCPTCKGSGVCDPVVLKDVAS